MVSCNPERGHSSQTARVEWEEGRDNVKSSRLCGRANWERGFIAKRAIPLPHSKSDGRSVPLRTRRAIRALLRPAGSLGTHWVPLGAFSSFVSLVGECATQDSNLKPAD